MARTDFAEDALVDPDEATDKPVTLLDRSREMVKRDKTKHNAPKRRRSSSRSSMAGDRV